MAHVKKKIIHQIDREWRMVAPFSKFHGKNGTRDYFQNSHPSQRSACFFMWQLQKILNVSNTLILKQIFRISKTLFKKTDLCFTIKNAKIENVVLWYKTAPLEANVKTNGMGSAKWTYHKDWSFASIFLKVLFQFKNLL